jgi:hypothetical protein
VSQPGGAGDHRRAQLSRVVPARTLDWQTKGSAVERVTCVLECQSRLPIAPRVASFRFVCD